MDKINRNREFPRTPLAAACALALATACGGGGSGGGGSDNGGSNGASVSDAELAALAANELSSQTQAVDGQAESAVEQTESEEDTRQTQALQHDQDGVVVMSGDNSDGCTLALFESRQGNTGNPVDDSQVKEVSDDDKEFPELFAGSYSSDGEERIQTRTECNDDEVKFSGGVDLSTIDPLSGNRDLGVSRIGGVEGLGNSDPVKLSEDYVVEVAATDFFLGGRGMIYVCDGCEMGVEGADIGLDGVQDVDVAVAANLRYEFDFDFEDAPDVIEMGNPETLPDKINDGLDDVEFFEFWSQDHPEDGVEVFGDGRLASEGGVCDFDVIYDSEAGDEQSGLVYAEDKVSEASTPIDGAIDMTVNGSTYRVDFATGDADTARVAEVVNDVPVEWETVSLSDFDDVDDDIEC